MIALLWVGVWAINLSLYLEWHDPINLISVIAMPVIVIGGALLVWWWEHW